MARKRTKKIFRERSFSLNVGQHAIFISIRNYLNDTYIVYDAFYKNGVGNFKIKYEC
jgi:hypothetical protein